MGFTLHHSLVACALLASPFVAIAVVVIAIIFRRKDSQFRMARPLTILAAAALCCAVLVATDPGRFILWFID
jgi:amino acid permease